jgi:hypothetical protein
MEDQQMMEPGGGGGTADTPAQLDTQQAPGAPPPPPSPLSGCYLLIVVGEPYSPEHKEIILQRIAKGRSLILCLMWAVWTRMGGTGLRGGPFQ